jgi:hypothetical protein
LVRDADGGQVIEIVPDGATGEDFASRPVGQRVSRYTCLGKSGILPPGVD